MPPLDTWPRPGPTPRQRRIDLYIGLVMVGTAVLNVLMMRSMGLFIFERQPSALEQYAFAVAVALPLIWRRSHPEIVMVVISAVFIAGQILGTQETQVASGILFAAIYAGAAWSRDRRRIRVLCWVVIGAMFTWLGVSWLLSFDDLRENLTNSSGPVTPILAALLNGVIVNILIFFFAYYMGQTAWISARREALLEAQAEELRRAQELGAERAVIGERVRIARELHDVVAHHVSVMGIQASAARRSLAKDPARASVALGAVEDSARTAVDELRRMLGALRASDAESVPAPTARMDRIGELVDSVREAGLTGHYAVYGEPQAIPDSVSQAAYRIVQEAITNTLKHAHASTVDVRVRYLARDLEIDVADNGRGPGQGPVSGGMGLIGMRERVAVHEGTIETGRRADGGFRVRVRLPFQREMAAQA